MMGAPEPSPSELKSPASRRASASQCLVFSRQGSLGAAGGTVSLGARVPHLAPCRLAERQSSRGNWGFSDYSNALKLGYDQETGDWTAAVGLADIPASMLPRVVAPGDQVGAVSARASEETGLTAGVPVLAGASDGLASLIGSGASEAGHANTTLGPPWFGKSLPPPSRGLGPGMYCHHLPSNLWAPGAASNTGPGSLQFDDRASLPRKWIGARPRICPLRFSATSSGRAGNDSPSPIPRPQSFFDGRPASPDEAVRRATAIAGVRRAMGL